MFEWILCNINDAMRERVTSQRFLLVCRLPTAFQSCDKNYNASFKGFMVSNHNHDHNSHHKITFPSLYTLRFKARYFFSIPNLSWPHLWFYVSCHDIQFFNSHGICDNEIVKEGLKKSGIFPDLVKPTNSLKWEY